MDPKKTAVVLIEYQNDFASEGGTLHQAVKPVMDSTRMLAAVASGVSRRARWQGRGRRQVARIRGRLTYGFAATVTGWSRYSSGNSRLRLATFGRSLKTM